MEVPFIYYFHAMAALLKKPVFLFLFFSQFYFTAIQAATIPASLYGNWLATDGSNRFVIGIYPSIICYNNRTWRISSEKEVQGHWQLKLSDKTGVTGIELQCKDSNTLVISGPEQQVLKNIPTYNSRYQPVQQSFRKPLFARGTAFLTGYIHAATGRKPGSITTVSIECNNMLTGKMDYFFAETDSLGCFTLQLPLHYTQHCRLKVDERYFNWFMAQPGDTTLLAVNPDKVSQGTDFNYRAALQRICLMGDNAAFNNLYQHFAWWQSNFSFETPYTTAIDAPFYKDAFAKAMAAIDSLFPSYMAGQWFIDYIKADTKYKLVHSILNRLQYQPDSAALKKLYDQYLAQETSVALLHENFYKIARKYMDYPGYTSLVKGETRNLAPKAQVLDRIEHEYAPLLPAGYTEAYKRMEHDGVMFERRENTAIIEKYFNGNRKEAYNFLNINGQINSQLLWKEARDSVMYSVYGILIPCAPLRFAVNMQHLFDNYESNNYFPSVHRLAIFRHYSHLPGIPEELMESFQPVNTFPLGASGLEIRGNDPNLKYINNESEWQTLLQKFKGMTVVLWPFSKDFNKEAATKNIYTLHKMQERYRGKKVIFLKCLQDWDESDYGEQLMKYLHLFSECDDLKNIYSLNYRISAHTMIPEHSEQYCVIYNGAALPHHPSKSVNFQPEAELDSVLAGKGHYNEGSRNRTIATLFNYNAEQVSPSVIKKLSTLQGVPVQKTWFLSDSTGTYFSYSVGTPIPKNKYDYDSTYQLLSFANDSSWIEGRFIVHPKQNEYIRLNEGDTFRFSWAEEKLRVYNRQKKAYKAFQLIFVSDEYLVLRSVQP